MWWRPFSRWGLWWWWCRVGLGNPVLPPSQTSLKPAADARPPDCQTEAKKGQRLKKVENLPGLCSCELENDAVMDCWSKRGWVFDGWLPSIPLSSTCSRAKASDTTKWKTQKLINVLINKQNYLLLKAGAAEATTKLLRFTLCGF